MKPIEGRSECRCYEGGKLKAIQNTTDWSFKQLVAFINFQRHELGREVIVARPKECNCAGYLDLFGFHRHGCENN